MSVFLLFAVVVSTAIFLYLFIKIKQREIRSIQELLLQFIDQFEEQYQDILTQFEAYKQSLDAKYNELYQIVHYNRNEIDSSQKQLEAAEDQKEENVEINLDPLQIKDRYQSVVQLQQEGKSIDEIARSTGKGKGEIQLILELFEKQLKH